MNTGGACLALRPRVAGQGRVEPITGQEGWRLILPSVQGGYHLAQLDDYRGLPRTRFSWNPPLRFSLEARLYPEEGAGTWGFGFWNDPFVFLGGAGKRLPTGPQALWFFGAGPDNYLSLHEGVPANGFFAGVTSWQGPWWAWLRMALAAWRLAFPRGRADFRRLVSRFMKQWGIPVPVSPTTWHRYTLEWRPDRVRFWVDEVLLGEAPLAPHGPLGLVIWVDNQFAAWPPNGLPRFGVLPVSVSVMLEVRNLQCHPGV